MAFGSKWRTDERTMVYFGASWSLSNSMLLVDVITGLDRCTI